MAVLNRPARPPPLLLLLLLAALALGGRYTAVGFREDVDDGNSVAVDAVAA